MGLANARAVLPRISVMMFLQFFALGSWLATLSLAMGKNGLGKFVGDAYESAPIGAIFAPLFLGLLADRFFSSERVMGVLMLLGGLIMCGIAMLAPLGADKGSMIVILMIAYMLCYMPTFGLGNTITFSHVTQQEYPKARVWGTIGWIMAGLVLGALGWSGSLNIFWVAAATSLVSGCYCFTLPHTPPPLKGKPLDVGSLFMRDAFRLLKDPAYCVFAICSFLICIPLAYYYGQTPPYLSATGFTEAAATMTLGQMSEIVFMLLIPFFFRRLGVKWMLLVGMLCWVTRYVFFAMAASEQVTWMLLMGVVLHGVCYDFFFVTGYIYTDQKAPIEIRGQAQSLLVFLTQGLGLFVGYRMAFGEYVDINGIGRQPSGNSELTAAIKVLNEGKAEIGFVDQLMGMFGKGYPEGLEPSLVTKAMTDWKNYWMFPAMMAAAVSVVFLLAFWEKKKVAQRD
jgi:nucleoside transporter